MRLNKGIKKPSDVLSEGFIEFIIFGLKGYK